jgi:hypothetical protein
LTWNWDASSWKKSTKVLLGAATIWPFVYIPLFIAAMFSMVLFLPAAERAKASCGRLDVLQLDRKIKAGQIKELTIRSDEIVAKDRIGTCTYLTTVGEDTTRQEILTGAREIVDGRQRVEVIDENASEPAPPFFAPLGFGALMLAHMLTIFLTMALMPFYIILAVKNERLDETMRIVWVILACTVGMFANPVYWYLYIWRTPKPPPTASPGTL